MKFLLYSSLPPYRRGPLACPSHIRTRALGRRAAGTVRKQEERETICRINLRACRALISRRVKYRRPRERGGTAARTFTRIFIISSRRRRCGGGNALRRLTTIPCAPENTLSLPPVIVGYPFMYAPVTADVLHFIFLVTNEENSALLRRSLSLSLFVKALYLRGIGKNCRFS